MFSFKRSKKEFDNYNNDRVTKNRTNKKSIAIYCKLIYTSVNCNRLFFPRKIGEFDSSLCFFLSCCCCRSARQRNTADNNVKQEHTNTKQLKRQCKYKSIHKCRTRISNEQTRCEISIIFVSFSLASASELFERVHTKIVQ